MLSDGWEAGAEPAGRRAPAPRELDGLALARGAGAGHGGRRARRGRGRGATSTPRTGGFAATSMPSPRRTGRRWCWRSAGLATVAEVYLNGELVLESESMFAAHAVDVSRRLRGANELAICCRALAPRLAQPRKPRARWRTRLVSDGNLRFYRTMLLGRAPGFAPGPAVVGPWRPVSLERRRGCVLDGVRLRTRLDDDGTGRLACRVAARAVAGTALPMELELSVARSRRDDRRRRSADRRRRCSLTLTRVAPWWPHTHGEPALHDVALADRRRAVASRPCRLPAACRRPADLEADGLSLRVNGVPVFARGAVWTPLDLRAPARVRGAAAAGARAGRGRGHEHAPRPRNRRLRERRRSTTSATSWASSSGRTSCSPTSTTPSPTTTSWPPWSRGARRPRRARPAGPPWRCCAAAARWPSRWR